MLVQIPVAVAKKIGIAAGEIAELVVKGDHILIQKVNRLDSLLSQITPENLHSEIEIGVADLQKNVKT